MKFLTEKEALAHEVIETRLEVMMMLKRWDNLQKELTGDTTETYIFKHDAIISMGKDSSDQTFQSFLYLPKDKEELKAFKQFIIENIDRILDDKAI